MRLLAAGAAALVLAGAPAAAPPAGTPPSSIVAPSGSQQAIQRILAQPRYRGLRQGPTLQQRVELWLLQALFWGLSHLFGLTGKSATVVAALCAVLLLGAAAWVLRPALRGPSRQARAGTPMGERASPDHFAAADRLAAQGELEAAVRELAAGVAAALGEERTWEGGPLTVREIFARSADPGRLGPLLGAFEAAAYGGRPPDPDTYARAAEAARPFRPLAA